MINLLVDAGNTSIKVAVSDGDSIIEEKRVEDGALGPEVSGLVSKYGQMDVVALSDVRGLSPEELSILKSAGLKWVDVKGEGVRIPIINKYGTPHTLGADRLCAAVGASALFPGRDCVIVDFGTAITIDFLTGEGEFLGGNISLGLNTRFKALNHFTGKLPLLEKVDQVEPVGLSTAGAMASGVILGTIFEMEGYIERYPGHTFIFTGGDAIFFAEKLKSPIFVVCNLVLMGLSQIAKTNVI